MNREKALSKQSDETLIAEYMEISVTKPRDMSHEVSCVTTSA